VSHVQGRCKKTEVKHCGEAVSRGKLLRSQRIIHPTSLSLYHIQNLKGKVGYPAKEARNYISIIICYLFYTQKALTRHVIVDL